MNSSKTVSAPPSASLGNGWVPIARGGEGVDGPSGWPAGGHVGQAATVSIVSGDVMVHPTASVSEAAIIGDGTRVWNEAQVREGARIGRDCILAKGAYVDTGVLIGDRVKLENGVSVFKGARLASAVFVGPHSCLLNDKLPRAATPGGCAEARAGLGRQRGHG